jgi:hypothetical protein
MRRYRLKRRLIWAGVLLGLLLLCAAASVLGVYAWARDLAARTVRPLGSRVWA